VLVADSLTPSLHHLCLILLFLSGVEESFFSLLHPQRDKSLKPLWSAAPSDFRACMAIRAAIFSFSAGPKEEESP